MLRTFVTVLALAPLAVADVVSIPAEIDTTLFNDPSGALSNGEGPVMFVGRAGGTSTAPIRRGLVRFGVAGTIPAGSTVHSVQLQLANTSGNTGARQVQVHRVLASWGEGASSTSSGQGAPAQAGDATWLHTSFPGEFWTAPGGDFVAAPSATLSVDALGIYLWPSTPAAVADVQSWVDAPGTDFGWLIKLDVETVAQTTKVFGTSEAAVAAERPLLIVDYSPPPVLPYCVPGLSSLGCAVVMAPSGTPSASAGSGFVLSLLHAPPQRAASLVYSLTGPAALPFHGSLLCIAPPLVRSSVVQTDGSDPGCGGGASLDFNTRVASGIDPRLVAGTVAYLQWHVRDPANPQGSLVTSDALRVELLP